MLTARRSLSPVHFQTTRTGAGKVSLTGEIRPTNFEREDRTVTKPWSALELLRTLEAPQAVPDLNGLNLVSLALLLAHTLITYILQANADDRQSPDFMFSLYLKEAEKVDRQMVEDWKGTTDGILIFVRGMLVSQF
jgi:hypothetical protein